MVDQYDYLTGGRDGLGDAGGVRYVQLQQFQIRDSGNDACVRVRMVAMRRGVSACACRPFDAFCVRAWHYLQH
jgi:hypothetical protein